MADILRNVLQDFAGIHIQQWSVAANWTLLLLWNFVMVNVLQMGSSHPIVASSYMLCMVRIIFSKPLLRSDKLTCLRAI